MTILNYESKEMVAILTINSPPANALSTSLLEKLSATLDDIEENNQEKVIIIKSEGRFFSAGADIKEFRSSQEPSVYQEMAEKGQQLFNRMEQFKIPIIAAIHGAALGAGLELAMACHIRIATENAQLGLPELSLGIIPGYAGTQRLPHYVGTAKAYEMILSGEPINGKEAHCLGLVNKAVSEDELLEETMILAKKITNKSSPTINSIMSLIPYAKTKQFDLGVKMEAEQFGYVFGTEGAKEGIQAFIEKRKPNLQDK